MSDRPLEFEVGSPMGDSIDAHQLLHMLIEQRLGVSPNFFRPTTGSMKDRASLLELARFAYLDNPLPSLFKERLIVFLSRFCEVRYCVARHLGFLIGLGRPAGDERAAPQSIEDALRLMRRSLPRDADAETHIACCAAFDEPLREMPVAGSELEEALFTCAAHAFLQTFEAARALTALKRVLGSRWEPLMVLLTFVQTAHTWTRKHPELELEDDIKQLMATNHSLAECLLNDPEVAAGQRGETLMRNLEMLCECSHETLQRQRAETRLQESEARYRGLVNVLPTAVVTCDAEGRITFFNELAVELWGCRPEAGETYERFCGQFRLRWPDGTLIPRDQLPMGQAVCQGSSVRNQEVLLEQPLGKRVHVLVNIDPLRDADGRIIGAINAFSDITDLKQAEAALRESEALTRGVLNSLPEHVAVLDLKGLILAVNEPWIDFARSNGGQDRAAVPIGINYLELFHANSALDDEHAREAYAQMQALLAGRIDCCVVEYPCHSPDQARWFLMNGRRAGNKAGHVVISHMDITQRKQAEEALRIARHRLETALDASQVVLFHQDRELRYTWIHNPALGYAIHEVIGKRDRDLCQRAEEVANTEAIKRSVMATGISRREEVCISQDGEPRYFDLVVQPAYGGNGDIEGVHCAAIDVTSRKRNEQAVRESEGRFRIMADGLPLIVWVHDAQGKQEFVNQTFCEYFGVPREQMRDKKWQMLVHPEDAERYATEFTRCLREQCYFNAEVRVRDAQGRWRWLESWGRPRFSESGDFAGLVGTSADITDRKRAEEALRDADRRKNVFLATLAHELRNPLATIRSGLEVFRLRHDDEKLVAETREMMERQFTHLVALVDDLLEVSRVSQGKLKLRRESVSVAEFTRSAVETCRPLIEENEHVLMLDLPTPTLNVEGDSHRLSQLLANLISNAAKYTPRGGRIEVSARQRDDSVVIAVKDSGIGIDQDKLDFVFEMFAQVDKGDSAGYTGLGIGLSLVKSLVELHGGTVAVSSPGKGAGSTFTVRLPLSHLRAESEDPQDLEIRSVASVSRRILVVDDNEVAARLLAIVVKALGHEVSTAVNGQEAVERGRTFEPEIVIMDIGMPIMDGYQAARIMRAEGWGEKCVLIALTGWGQDDDKQKTREAGFDYHLIKPVEPNTLRRLLAEIVASGSQDGAERC